MSFVGTGTSSHTLYPLYVQCMQGVGSTWKQGLHRALPLIYTFYVGQKWKLGLNRTLPLHYIFYVGSTWKLGLNRTLHLNYIFYVGSTWKQGLHRTLPLNYIFYVGSTWKQGLHRALPRPVHRLRAGLQEGPRPPHAEGQLFQNVFFIFFTLKASSDISENNEPLNKPCMRLIMNPSQL